MVLIIYWYLYAIQHYLYQGANMDGSNEEAPENIADMFVTWPTFHSDNDWLNEEAP